MKNGSFWLRDILKFLDIFKGFTVVQIVGRKWCLLWDDLCHSQVLTLELIELHSFAKKFISVKMVVSRNSALQLFHLPISKSDFAQFSLLSLKCENLHLDEGPDISTYTWNSNSFSSAKA